MCTGTWFVTLMWCSMFHRLQTGHPRCQIGLHRSRNGTRPMSSGHPRWASGFLHHCGLRQSPTSPRFRCRAAAARWISWSRWVSPTAAATASCWTSTTATCREWYRICAARTTIGTSTDTERWRHCSHSTANAARNSPEVSWRNSSCLIAHTKCKLIRQVRHSV